jgi:hypothetical protein
MMACSGPGSSLASTLRVSPLCRAAKEMGYKSHGIEREEDVGATAGSTKGVALKIASRRVWIRRS